MKKVGLIWLLAAAPLAYADGITELRAALARMGAREPVRVAVSLESHSRGGDDDKPDTGRATFEAEHGADGLRLIYAPDLITRAQQEARANGADPEKPTPTRTAMRQVDPADVIEMLDAAAALTRRLDRATLVRDQRITVGGRAVRQLTMSLRPSLSKSDAKRVKSFELTLIVNVDGEGIPLSAELRQSMKAKFLLISFEQNQQESWVFGRAGDRLVAVRHHEKSTGSGMGQKFESSKLMTLAVR